ncbi:MAG: hypothetical protein ABIO86_21865 [Sphingomonas sp.]
MAWREETERYDLFGLEVPFVPAARVAGAGAGYRRAPSEGSDERPARRPLAPSYSEFAADESTDALFENDSAEVARLIKAGDMKGAVKVAIADGERDDGKLANLLFFARHPERDPTKPLEPAKSKDDARLAKEWEKLRTDFVLPGIADVATDATLKVKGAHIASRLEAFRGSPGKKFKTMIETAAQKAQINPGLLAAAVIAETGGPSTYLTTSKVSSYHAGVDDFFAMRYILAKAVPAYADIKWDRKQKPVEHLNDAQKNQRIVKTIQFDSGADALLATAVYLKYAEVRLREDAKKLGGDFDSLPVETRLALIRMSMGAGRAGAQTRLVLALKGKDVLKRDWTPPKIYQTNRNATIRAAEAMFLSGWVFGIPLAATPVAAPKPTPEAWELEGENLDWLALEAEAEESETWRDEEESERDGNGMAALGDEGEYESWRDEEEGEEASEGEEGLSYPGYAGTDELEFLDLMQRPSDWQPADLEDSLAENISPFTNLESQMESASEELFAGDEAMGEADRADPSLQLTNEAARDDARASVLFEDELPPEPFRIRGGLYSAPEKKKAAEDRKGLILTTSVVGAQEQKLAQTAPSPIEIGKELTLWEDHKLGIWVSKYNRFTYYFGETLRAIGRLRDLLSAGASEAPQTLTALQKRSLRPTDDRYESVEKKQQFSAWRTAHQSYRTAMGNVAEALYQLELRRREFWTARGNLLVALADAKQLTKPEFEALDIGLGDLVSVAASGSVPAAAATVLAKMGDLLINAKKNREEYDQKIAAFKAKVKITNSNIKTKLEEVDTAGSRYWKAREATFTAIKAQEDKRMAAREHDGLFGQKLAKGVSNNRSLSEIRMPIMITGAWWDLAFAGLRAKRLAVENLTYLQNNGALFDKATFLFDRPKPNSTAYDDIREISRAAKILKGARVVLSDEEVAEWLAMNNEWDKFFVDFYR